MSGKLGIRYGWNADVPGGRYCVTADRRIRPCHRKRRSNAGRSVPLLLADPSWGFLKRQVKNSLKATGPKRGATKNAELTAKGSAGTRPNTEARSRQGIEIKSLLIVFALIAVGCENGADEGVESALREKYLMGLDAWVDNGGQVALLQEEVLETCGMLVMLEASAAEKIQLVTTRREDFHFRVDVCAKMTVNRVHAQPEFQQEDTIAVICDQAKIQLFDLLCVHSGLR